MGYWLECLETEGVDSESASSSKQGMLTARVTMAVRGTLVHLLEAGM
jgi:hypothetical protein